MQMVHSIEVTIARKQQQQQQQQQQKTITRSQKSSITINL